MGSVRVARSLRVGVPISYVRYDESIGMRSHRALKDVSVALEGAFLPLPSLSLAFCEEALQHDTDMDPPRQSHLTVKSASLSFFFLVALGMVESLRWMEKERQTCNQDFKQSADVKTARKFCFRHRGRR